MKTFHILLFIGIYTVSQMSSLSALPPKRAESDENQPTEKTENKKNGKKITYSREKLLEYGKSPQSKMPLQGFEAPKELDFLFK